MMGGTRLRISDKAVLIASIAGGVVSGLFYSSFLLMAAFLVPVQVVFGRSGIGSGLIAAGVSILVIALSQGLRLLQMGISDFGAFLSFVAPSMVLLSALAVMNAPWWKGRVETVRVIAPSAFCAALAVPVLVIASREGAIAKILEETITSLMRAAGGENYESSVLAVSLEPSILVERLVSAVNNSFAASIFMILGLSWIIGNRLAGEGSRGRMLIGPVEEYGLPYPAVWLFLGSWAAVLAVIVLRAPAFISAAAWNLALASSMAYFLQGFGIAVFLMKKWNAPRGLRIAAAAVFIVTLFSPTGGVAAVLLALFGVSETWIPYRTVKESENESNS
jgi:MFS family permease